MKKILLILTVFTIYNVNAQASAGGGDLGNSGLAQNMTGNAAYGGGFVVRNNARQIVDGTYYLFDEWRNTGVIITSDDQKFLLKNINLNLKTNAFESKIDDESVYIFNFNNVDKFVINNKVYKNYYWDDDSRVYQVLFDSDKFQLLKGYKVVLIEGSANPMLSRKNDRYIRKDYYFLRENGEIKRFKLKKGKILKVAAGDDSAKKRTIEEYARENKLSFTNDVEVQKILEFAAEQ